jgi:hypothetical protein
LRQIIDSTHDNNDIYYFHFHGSQTTVHNHTNHNDTAIGNPVSSMTLVAILFLLSLVSNSSLANQNYNAYNYDMTTPLFTPDGRLLQVEYASRAATHSSPVSFGKLAHMELL